MRGERSPDFTTGLDCLLSAQDLMKAKRLDESLLNKIDDRCKFHVALTTRVAARVASGATSQRISADSRQRDAAEQPG